MLYYFIFLSPSFMVGQTNRKAVQPSIMVVPFKKQTEKYIDKIEELKAYRSAIAKVDEYFLTRNYRTLDFVANYELIQQDQAKLFDKNIPIEQQIAMNANADIMVYFDAEYKNTGSERYVNIYLKAIDASTAQVLSSTEARSNIGNFDDYSLYMTSAIMNLGDNMLNTLQQQFEDFRENGKPMRVIFDVSQESIAMDDYVDGGILSDKIYEILENLAHNNYVRCNTNLDKRYGCDDVRMPLEKENKMYNINYFVKDLRRSLSFSMPSLKFKVSNTGSNIRVVIQ